MLYFYDKPKLIGVKQLNAGIPGIMIRSKRNSMVHYKEDFPYIYDISITNALFNPRDKRSYYTCGKKKQKNNGFRGR